MDSSSRLDYITSLSSFLWIISTCGREIRQGTNLASVPFKSQNSVGSSTGTSVEISTDSSQTGSQPWPHSQLSITSPYSIKSS